jgi:CubicO group peptidase (beta-lactamase class C family)
VKGELKNQEWVSPSTNTTADGSLYLTILDLAKWDAALYADKQLKQSSLAQMSTPVKLDGGKLKAYGVGWHTDKTHKRRVVYHGGAWQGFKSFIVRFPRRQIDNNLLRQFVGDERIQDGSRANRDFLPRIRPPRDPTD